MRTLIWSALALIVGFWLGLYRGYHDGYDDGVLDASDDSGGYDAS